MSLKINGALKKRILSFVDLSCKVLVFSYHCIKRSQKKTIKKEREKKTGLKKKSFTILFSIVQKK